jgi:hypothetical protein
LGDARVLDRHLSGHLVAGRAIQTGGDDLVLAIAIAAPVGERAMRRSWISV